jgi:hypothetical protein
MTLSKDSIRWDSSSSSGSPPKLPLLKILYENV